MRYIPHLPAIAAFVFLYLTYGHIKPEVTGEIFLPDGQSLPPGAVVEIEVANIGIAAASAKVVAKQTISDPKGTSVRFKLTYEEKALDSKRRYVATARIKDKQGALLFRSGADEPVITLGNPTKSVRLPVISVSR